MRSLKNGLTRVAQAFALALLAAAALNCGQSSVSSPFTGDEDIFFEYELSEEAETGDEESADAEDAEPTEEADADDKDDAVEKETACEDDCEEVSDETPAEEEAGEDEKESDSEEREIFCSCLEINDCCDGCNPINELSSCADDGLDCTREFCLAGECVHAALPNACVVDGACYSSGESPVENACVECRPGLSQREFSPADDGKACDDSDADTSPDSCKKGVCKGAAAGCECVSSGPGDPCCDGCHPINTGGACEADGVYCTTDVCGSEGYCKHELAPDYCLIDYACVPQGERSKIETCRVCDASANQKDYSNLPDETPCEDGNKCTNGDKCGVGVCKSGTAAECPAAPACKTGGACDPKTGACGYSNAEDGTACDDGNPNTSGDECKDGVCLGENCDCNTTDECCDGCLAINEGGACASDGFFCTKDYCSAGACKSEIEPDYCLVDGLCLSQGADNVDNPCEWCDASKNAYAFSSKPNNTPCAGGDPCVINEACIAGICVGGVKKVCEPSGQCYLNGECSSVSGACEYAAKPEGTACDDGNPETGGDSCRGGECLGQGCVCAGINECCDGCLAKNEGGACGGDGLACTADVCAAGVCEHNLERASCLIGGACYGASQTDPLNFCLYCDPEKGQAAWSAKQKGSACDDGDLCTTADACDGGACLGGTKLDCSNPPSVCKLPAECNPSVGACDYKNKQDGTACSDPANGVNSGNCRNGACVKEGCQCNANDACCDGCFPKNEGGACADDGLTCTSDLCSAGVCGHILKADSCLIGGACYAGGGLNPDNGCQLCDPAKNSSNWTVSPNNSPCSDSDACTKTDACLNGVCIGSDVTTCPAADSCRKNGTCDKTTGECALGEAYPDGTDCEDGNKCTLTDKCQAGSCAAGAPKNCLNGTDCVNYVCQAATGECKAQGTLPDETPCDDSLNCNGADKCKSGKCDEHQYPGSLPPSCDMNDDCWADSCWESANAPGYVCAHETLTGTACDDKVYCNGTDVCQAGLCSVHQWPNGMPPACETSDGCKTAICSEGSGAYVCGLEDKADMSNCDDSSGCNGSDYCLDGACVGHQYPNNLPPDCVSNNECVIDSCQNGSGVYFCVRDAQTLAGSACSDDGLSCTVDKCSGDGYCAHNQIVSTACLVNGACYAQYQSSPAAECEWCDPAIIQIAFWPKPREEQCSDDGRACTADHCDGVGSCQHDLNDGSCLINGSCRTDKEVNQSNECQWCDPEQRQFQWSNKPITEKCSSDGYDCTADYCDGRGACAHSLNASTCLINGSCYGSQTKNPANECQWCDPAASCVDFDQYDLSPACAWTDKPSNQPCSPDAYACTLDKCDGLGACKHDLIEASSCFIGSVCYADGTAVSGNDCKYCKVSESQTSWSLRPLNYTCNSDGFACTTDACDADGNCNHNIQDDKCLINNVCYNADQMQGTTSDATCKACKPVVSKTSWSPMPQGTQCESDAYSCTNDQCSNDGRCLHTLAAGKCVIDKVCYSHGDSNPDEDCKYCNQTTPRAWSNKTQGTACLPDDGIACTDDVCDSNGVCIYKLQPEKCYINNACVNSGSTNPINPCQYCDPAQNTNDWTPRPVNYGCSDGLACNGADACDAYGTCVHAWPSGLPPACEDANDCTADLCVEEPALPIGYSCSNLAEKMNGESCSDGNLCTKNDACDGGFCLGKPINCSNDNECARSYCDLSTGACVAQALPDGSSCQADKNLCTWDYCKSGACVIGDAPDCDDDNPCTSESCDAGTGLCVSEKLTSNSECDGSLCTYDKCDKGVCVPGAAGAVDCDASTSSSGDSVVNPTCADSVCNPLSGMCEDKKRQAGTSRPVVCGIVGINTKYCQDNPAGYDNACCAVPIVPMGNTCCGAPDPTPEGYTGCCVKNDFGAMVKNPKENAKCDDDGLACTQDYCDANGFCVHEIENGWCVIDAACVANGTKNPKNSCESCSPLAANPLSKVTWTRVSVGTACDDGNPCTTNDKCFYRSGSGGSPDGLYCGGTFNQTAGCDDDNPCTVDYCGRGGASCVNDPLKDYSECNDGVAGTINDVCISGYCSHADAGSPPLNNGSLPGSPDGYPDLVFSSGEAFFWDKNAGAFSSKKYDYNLRGYRGVKTADFNRDGYMDFAAANTAGDSVILWGPMSFNKTPTRIATTNARQVCAGDLNGDGYVDLVFANYSGASQVFINSPFQPGKFDAGAELDVPGAAASGCAIADMNGDGYADVVISKYQSAETNGSDVAPAYVFYGGFDSDEEYVFARAVFTWTDAATDLKASVFSHNFSGGRDFSYPELVFAFEKRPYSAVVMESAFGLDIIFLAAKTYAGGQNYLSGTYGTAVFDLNADGYMDVVLSSKLTAAQSGTSYVYYGGSGSAGDYVFSLGAALSTNSGRGACLADLNGDKETDAVIAQNAASSKLFWGASFASSSNLATTAQNGLEVVSAGDYNKTRGVCVCSIPGVCCDGCYSYNDGHYCDEDRSKVCSSGVCQPIINPFK